MKSGRYLRFFCAAFASLSTIWHTAAHAQINAGSQEHFTIKMRGEVLPLYLTHTSQKRGEPVVVQFANGATAEVGPVLVVGLRRGGVPKELRSAALQIESIPDLDASRILLRSSREVLEWSARLAGDRRIRYAHPDFKFELQERSLDPMAEPLFKDQWNLENTGQTGGTPGTDIDIRSAWKVTQGHPETVIGLLDLGFEQTHEDLADAWYVNPKEIPNNKRDDDGNGLIDDVSGWNFSTNRNNLIYGQNAKHGTATSGVLGARVNGKGISGICPKCKILPIVVSGKVSEDAAAIMYAVKMGVSVMSNSWGYRLKPPQTDVVSDALIYAAHKGRGGKGIPIIFAMNNAQIDDCRKPGEDISGHVDVIAVSSVDHNDLKVKDSAFGHCLAFVAPSATSAALGVPTTDRSGENGYNTDGMNNYPDLSYNKGFWGTSAAAPHVAGLYALLLSHEPQLTLSDANKRMRAAAVKIRSDVAKYDPKTGHSLYYGYGRVSATKLFE